MKPSPVSTMPEGLPKELGPERLRDLMTFLLTQPPKQQGARPFAISVVDEDTGRGVPLIELRTVNHQRFFTDSNGLVAFDEPGQMNADVFFSVSGHGYEFPRDGFGFRGKALRVTPGGSATLKVKRNNIAERLYRITGEGIYAASVRLGRDVPLKEPLLNSQVAGCDSVLNAVYRGKIYWFWGDTNRPAYPLGNFNATGATSELPGKGGLDPDRGIDLTYFTNDRGFVKGIAPMPGKGPTWIESVAVLPDALGRERLYMSHIKADGLKAVARGVAVWNDDHQQFEKLGDVDLAAPIYPKGHTFLHRDGGVDFLYFGHPFPLVRVPAKGSAFTDIQAYEAFTCLKEGSTLDAPEVERAADDRARYAWRKNAPPLGPDAEAKLIRAGKLKEDEVLLPVRDRDTGKAVRLHNGSVHWNAYRKKWVMVANEVWGKPSNLGEMWYAEADAPTGPWKEAVKIVTHDRMDFYNPKHHPMFNKDGGRVIYFEGTYTNTFSGNPDATPRYEYNQIMYKRSEEHTSELQSLRHL